MIETTLEAEVINAIRSLSLDVKRATGYKVYNRGGTDLIEKIVDAEALNEKLHAIKDFASSEQFSFGDKRLRRYIQREVSNLISELNAS